MDDNMNDRPPGHEPDIPGFWNSEVIPEINVSLASEASMDEDSLRTLPDANVSDLVSEEDWPLDSHTLPIVDDEDRSSVELNIGTPAPSVSNDEPSQPSGIEVTEADSKRIKVEGVSFDDNNQSSLSNLPSIVPMVTHKGTAEVPIKEEEDSSDIKGHSSFTGMTVDAPIVLDSDDSDDEEDSLFVSQGMIDLTSETLEDSEARKKRLQQLQALEVEDLRAHHPDVLQIKEEEMNPNMLPQFLPFPDDKVIDSDYQSDTDESSSDEEMPKRQRRATTKDKGKAVATTEPTVTASNKADDTIMDPEDIRDQLAELEARQRRLSRRQENSVLKTAEAKELKDARVRIAKLKATLNDLTAPEEAGEPLITNNEESNDALCEAPGVVADAHAVDDDAATSDFDTVREDERIRELLQQALGLDRLPPVAHAQTKTGNKRKGLAFPKSHAKKARTATGAIIKTKSKKRDASKQHQKLIRAMLLQQDSIAAGQEMASMPILSGFAATKAGEQQKQFQALVAACQDSEEKKRMRGDKVMVNQARGALRGKYTPQDEKFLIKGMTTPLFAYQFAGSGWMVGREKSEQGPKGGILADSMGLGKTLETIACIAGNPPSRDDLALGLSRTLIVVPANAVNQWVDEIYRHGDGLLAGHYKESAKSNMAYLNKCSIWVTSYHEVSSHYPTNKFIKSQEGIESMTQEDCDAVRMKYSGPLMKMKFLRVVLDEAHAIKNHKSHTSASCLALTSKYRWALSGTPIHNRVEEIYPYMRFLDIEHTSSLYQFTRSYLPTKRNDAPDIIRKRKALAGLLEAVMLKRSMNTKFFGHALFKLPKPHVLEDVKVPMSREETLIYRRVEDKFRRRAIKEIGKAPGPGLVTNWLLYVLRLRQAVAHPFLLENLMRKEFEVEDYAWLKTQLAEVRTETPLILQIGSWCEEEHQHKSDVEHDDIDGAGLNAAFDFLPQLQKLEERRMMLDRMEESGNSDFMEEAEEIQDDINELCKRCGLPSDNGFQPKCGHLFCRECIENHIAAMNEGVAQGLGCRDCSKLITNIKSRTNKDSQSQKKAPENKGAKQGAWRRATASKHRGREDNVNGIQPTSSSKLESLFIQESDMKSLDKLIPSAKTIVLKNIIMDWHSRYPDDKMIIFTQFVDMGRIIGRILQKEDIDFLYFFGSMSQAKKYQAQEDFTQRPEIKVLVASLQCSGQALNLACANRVFILDLWWNYAMEQQAFGRVYRMGQNKETWRVRIMVKNTIDERMADLQAKKMAAIDAAITDHDSAKLVLTQEELAGLLGRVVFDQHGKIKDIVPDYDDESDEDDEDDDDHHRTAATTESSSQSSSNTQ